MPTQNLIGINIRSHSDEWEWGVDLVHVLFHTACARWVPKKETHTDSTGVTPWGLTAMRCTVTGWGGGSTIPYRSELCLRRSIVSTSNGACACACILDMCC